MPKFFLILFLMSIAVGNAQCASCCVLLTKKVTRVCESLKTVEIKTQSELGEPRVIVVPIENYSKGRGLCYAIINCVAATSRHGYQFLSNTLSGCPRLKAAVVCCIFCKRVQDIEADDEDLLRDAALKV